jgi:hypothetical protein
VRSDGCVERGKPAICAAPTPSSHWLQLHEMRTSKPAATPDRKRLSLGPIASSPRPRKRVEMPRKTSSPAANARQITELVREAVAKERAAASATSAYHARRELDRRISALADRLADKPLAGPGDLLVLALAGWHAAGARQALVRAVLRAGGLNPKAPQLRAHSPARGCRRVSRSRL